MIDIEPIVQREWQVLALKDKDRALIVGGTHGLGKALAGQLAAKGWKVIATGRANFDIAEPDTWEPWILRTGQTKFDLVIFCAGTIAPETWYRKPMEAYLHSYRVHAAGPIEFLATYRDILFGWWTKVVFISSVGAVNAGIVDLAYGGSKAALEKMAKALAEHESWPVTLVRLDLVDTRMLYALPTDTLHGRPILSPDEAAEIVLKEAGIK
jgi:NAD(P)-dependent dehydrogenase (short-subunit alcohol dehydrogenase family)